MQFDDVYSTIQKFNAASAESDILAILRDAATRSGFDHFIISGLPPRGVNVRPFVLAAEWPAEWFTRYFGRDYTQFDPVARHCFSTTLPFLWRDAPYDRADDKHAQRVMDEATEFGLGDGFCVPVHMEDGSRGCISYGRQTAVLSDEVRLGLHLISLYAHGKLRAIHRPTKLNAPRLTPRQVEVLKWISWGKSFDDTAAVLGVSSTTINYHMQGAQRALGTLNRTHTVAEAMRYGLLPL